MNQSGDGRAAFLEQVARHQGVIHKLCRLYFNDPLEREDAFQDALLNAWRAYPRFAGQAAFSTWLYRVALNTILMRVRSARAERRRSGPVGSIESAAIPDRSAAAIEAHELRLAIESLDDAEKSIILLHLEAFSYPEIAEITGLTESHVGVKINRIKAKLKTRLEGPEA
jgi:RNA polymerase sigma factor (sigma-70 family)